ncbi:MAG: glutaredoxin family protein [Ottowia sp.]|nr:glutaredoxin family protein [Ottowia sp.]
MKARGLRLLSRRWCHLCHEMEAALQPLARELNLPLEVLDVDADAQLEARWDEHVPVLLAGDGAEICRHRLDEAALRAWAAEARA